LSHISRLSGFSPAFILGESVDDTGKKGEMTGKKGEMTGKKGEIGKPEKPKKTLQGNKLADALARARKKNKKKQEKKRACARADCPRFLPGFPCRRGRFSTKEARRNNRPPEGADCPPRHPARRLGRLLGVGHAAPRPPWGCAPLRALNGHAGTPANAQQRRRRGKADGDAQAR